MLRSARNHLNLGNDIEAEDRLQSLEGLEMGDWYQDMFDQVRERLDQTVARGYGIGPGLANAHESGGASAAAHEVVESDRVAKPSRDEWNETTEASTAAAVFPDDSDEQRQNPKRGWMMGVGLALAAGALGAFWWLVRRP